MAEITRRNVIISYLFGDRSKFNNDVDSANKKVRTFSDIVKQSQQALLRNTAAVSGLGKAKRDLANTQDKLTESTKKELTEAEKLEKELKEQGVTLSGLTQLQKLYQEELDNAVIGTSEYVDAAANLNSVNRQIQQSQPQRTFREMARDVNILGVNVGEVVDGLRRKRSGLRGVIQGLGGATNGFKALRVAIISTGIGALIIALTSLVLFIQRTTAGADALNKIFNGIGATVDVLLTRLTDFGTALVGVFNGTEGAAEGLRQSFRGIGEEISNAIAESNRLVELQRDIVNSRRAITFNEAVLNKLIKEQNLLGEDTSRNLNDRENAIKRSLDLNTQLLNGRKDFNAQEEEALRTQIRLEGDENKQVELRQQLSEKIAEGYEIETQFLELQTTQNNKLNTIRAEADRARLARLEEIRKLEETIARNNERFSERNRDLQIELLSGLEQSSQRLITAAGRDIEEIRQLIAKGLVDEDLANQQIELIRNVLTKGLQDVTTEFLSDLTTLPERTAEAFISTSPPDLFPDFEVQAQETANRTLGVFERLGRGLANIFGDEQTLQAIQNTFGSILDTASSNIDRLIDDNDRLIESSQKRLDILLESEDASASAIEAEEQRINDLQDQREAILERQRRVQAIQIALNSAGAISEAIQAIIAGFASGNVFQGILNATTLATTLISTIAQVRGALSGIPAFAEGTESVPGVGGPKSDNIPAWLSPKERVVPVKFNQPLLDAGITNAQLPGYAILGQQVANGRISTSSVSIQQNSPQMQKALNEMVKQQKLTNYRLDAMETQVNVTERGIEKIVKRVVDRKSRRNKMIR